MSPGDNSGDKTMSEKNLSQAALAAIAALSGKKAFKDAKAELSEMSSTDIDVWVHLTGAVAKGQSRTKEVANPAVDFALLFEAACQEIAEMSKLVATHCFDEEQDAEDVAAEAVARAFVNAQSLTFKQTFKDEGGKAKLHEESAMLMGVDAYVNRSVSGAVSCKGVKVAEVHEGGTPAMIVKMVETAPAAPDSEDESSVA